MSQEKEKMEVINKPVEKYTSVIIDTINTF